MSKIKWLDWYGCYEESNKPFYVPAAFTHPAKMAVGLCRRIFEFMEEKGMLRKGDIVVDPFGGIGTTLLIGTTLGYRCIGNELEEKFVELTKANIEKNRKYFESTGRVMPIVIQGDSRQLSKLIQEHCKGIVTSAPYGKTQDGRGIAKRGYHNEKKRKGVYKRIVDTIYEDKHFSKNNISNLKDGNVNAVISSPPYADSINSGKNGIDWEKAGRPDRVDPSGKNNYPCNNKQEFNYGKSEGQIGKEKNETYWEAMKQVYTECWKILKKDGHMAIVVKDFVRKKERVPLCDNTVKLLESIGFVTVYRIRAWTLTETRHDDLFKGEVVHRKERKSFFRRLAEQKGSPRIDWEEVIIVRKV